MVAGRPMVMHTLAAFGAVTELAGVLVAVSPGDMFLQDLSAPFFVAACGGSTRAQTVFNGMVELQQRGADAGDWVLVHDAARCLITPVLIEGLIQACRMDSVGGLLAVNQHGFGRRDQ